MPAIIEKVYVDTSLLAKYYVLELGSGSVKDYLAGLDFIAVSSLTITEMRCLLGRRKRTGLLTAELEQALYAEFLQHIGLKVYSVLEVENQHFSEAAALIGQFPGIPLRTLDALHLAVAQDYGISRVATADKVMAGAAAGMGFVVDMPP